MNKKLLPLIIAAIISGTFAFFVVGYAVTMPVQSQTQTAAVGSVTIGKSYQPTAEYSSIASKYISAVTTKYSSGDGSVTTALGSQSTFISTTPLTKVQTPSGSAIQSSLVKDQYIVELTQSPLSVKYAQLKNQNGAKVSSADLNSALSAQKKLISNQQSSFLQNLPSAVKAKNAAIISNISGSKSASQKSFSVVLNAVVLNMTADEVKSVSNLSQVKKIEQVRTVRVDLMDSVPLIKAPEVWADNFPGAPTSTPITGKGIKIAIIDTGVDYLHPDLGGCFGPKVVNGQITSCKVAGGFDFVNSDPDPMDDMGHGTHVADIAAGNGMPKGVAPDATIYAYKVCNSGGSCDNSNIIAGLEAATDPNYDGNLSDHLDIASLSLGGPGNPDDEMSTAVDNAVNAGVVVTVAAGNNGPASNTIGSPGTARNAITVGATDKQDNIASFSSRGPVTWTASDGNTYNLVKPDVVAPGVNICAARWSTAFSDGDTNCYHDSTHVAISGTSMATPHVAGEAALLLQLHHDWTPAEIKAAIRDSSKHLSGNCPVGYSCGISVDDQGQGRIDALQEVQSPRPPIALLAPITVGNGTISIRGTATAQNFKQYKISYGQGQDPSSFTDLYTSNQPVSNGVLYSGLDTTSLNEGTYAIRLMVTDSAGNTSSDAGLLEVNNMEITSVGNNLNYINGGVQQILGSIHLPSATSYRVLLAPIPGNTTTICSGNSIPTGNTICSADFSNVADGKYYLYLEVYQNGVWNIDEPFTMAVVKELLNNWPQKLIGFPRGNLVVLHQPNSPTKLVVPYYTSCSNAGSCSYPPTLLFYGLDGTYSRLQNLADGSTIPDDSMPSVLYNPTRQQNVLGLAESFGDNSKKIIDTNGSVIKSWDQNSSMTQNSSITAFNRDGAGIGLYTGSVQYNGSQTVNQINGYDVNGNKLKNFPVIIPPGSQSGSLTFVHPVFLSDGISQNLAVITGEFTNDAGYMRDLKLYANVFSATNQLINKQLVFDGTGKSYILFGVNPIAADLNNDGKTEMIFSFSLFDSSLASQILTNPDAYKTYIKEIDSGGNLVASVSAMPGRIVAQLAVGNLGHGKPSIVAVFQDNWAVTSDQIVAYDGSLNTIFANTEQHRINGVTIGDVDGDGQSEIVAPFRNIFIDGTPSGIGVFDGNGNLKREIDVPTLGSADDFMIPILDSVNGDGHVNAIIQSSVWPSNVHAGTGNYNTVNLYILDLGGTTNSSSSPRTPNFDWPTVLRDNQNTGCFNCLASSTVSTSTPPTVTLTATPNPIALGQSTTINWSSTNATTCSSLPPDKIYPVKLPMVWQTPATSGSFPLTASLFMTVGLKNLTLYLSCTGPGGTATTSVTVQTVSQPTATITGTSTLSMIYDPYGGENSLRSTFNVAVNAGSQDQKITKNNAFWSYVSLPGGGNSATGVQQYAQPSGTTDDGNGYYVVHANTTATFIVQNTLNPKTMFAGAYHGTMAMVSLGDLSNQTRLTIPAPNTTNMVVIVGEVSPYLNSIVPNLVPANQGVTVNGVRFSITTPNIVTLQSKTMSKTYSVVSPKGLTLYFVPNVPADSYSVQVTHPVTGASNGLGLTVIAPLATSTSSDSLRALPSATPSTTPSPSATPSSVSTQKSLVSPTPSPSPSSPSSPTPTPTPTSTVSPTVSSSPSRSPSPSTSPYPSPSPSTRPKASPSASPTTSPAAFNGSETRYGYSANIFGSFNEFLQAIFSK